MDEILACTMDQSPQKKWDARANLELQEQEAHMSCVGSVRGLMRLCGGTFEPTVTYLDAHCLPGQSMG